MMKLTYRFNMKNNLTFSVSLLYTHNRNFSLNWLCWDTVPFGTAKRYGCPKVLGTWAQLARTAWYGLPVRPLPEGAVTGRTVPWATLRGTAGTVRFPWRRSSAPFRPGSLAQTGYLATIAGGQIYVYRAS
jgi:hypothetical protein